MSNSDIKLQIGAEINGMADISAQVQSLIDLLNKIPDPVKIKVEVDSKDISSLQQQLTSIQKTSKKISNRSMVNGGVINTSSGKNSQSDANQALKVITLKNKADEKQNDILKQRSRALKSVTKEARKTETRASNTAKSIENMRRAVEFGKTKKESLKEGFGGSDAANQLRALQSELSTKEKAISRLGGNVTAKQIAEVDALRVNLDKVTESYKKQVDAEKKSGRSLNERLFDTSKQLLARTISSAVLTGAIQGAKQMVQASLEIESAMAQIQIVTGATDSQMATFFDNSVSLAKELGKNVTDVSASIETFARLGYNMSDSSGLAKFANIMSNVAATGVDEATTGLTSIIKGYELEASDAEHVSDVLVAVGQKYAISAEELMTAFQRGGAALNASGTSFEQSAALFAATNASLQNAETTGTMWKTVSARIRGAKTELEELGEETDDVGHGLSKYRNEIKALSGFDIMQNDTTYKNMYDIFTGLASVWDDMQDVDQARVAEILGGTRNTSGIMSTIQNIKDAIGAYDVAMNSAGTSTEANNIIMDTTNAKIGQLKASFQELSSDVVDSNLSKAVVTGLDLIVGGADNVVEAFGSIGTAIGTFALGKTGINIIGTALKNQGTTLAQAASTIISQINPIAAGITAASVVVGAAITQYQKHIAEQDSMAKESGDNWEKSTKSVQEYADKVKDLREDLSTGTLTAQQEKDVKQELLSIQQQLVDTYGSQAEGINLVNGELETQLELMSQLTNNEASEFLNKNVEAINRAKNAMTEVKDLPIGYLAGDSNNEQIKSLYSIIDDLNEKYGDVFSVDGFNEMSPDMATIMFTGDTSLAEEALNDFMNMSRDASAELEDHRILDGVMQSTSDAINRNGIVLKENQTLYKQAQKAELATDKQLYGSDNEQKSAAKWLSDYSKAIEDYNKALASGDPSQINEARTAFEGVHDAINGILDSGEMTGYVDLFQEALDGLSDGKSELASAASGASAEIEKTVISVKDLQSAVSDYITTQSNLATALANSRGVTGMTTEDITNVMQAFSQLEGYNAATLFEETATGIRLNVDQFERLNEQLNTQKLQEYSDTISTLRDELYQAQARGENTNALQNEISQAKLLQAQLEGSMSSYNKLKQAMSGGNERDEYEFLGAQYKGMKELVDQGWYDDASLSAYLDTLLSSDQRTGDNEADFKKLSKKIGNTGHSLKDYWKYEDGELVSDGVIDFWDDVKSEMGEEIFKDGIFDLSDGGLDKIAQKFGTTREVVEALAKAAQDAGATIRLNDYDFTGDVDAAVKTLKELKDSDLVDLGDLDLDFEIDTSSTNELSDYINSLEETRLTIDPEVNPEAAAALDELIYKARMTYYMRINVDLNGNGVGDLDEAVSIVEQINGLTATMYVDTSVENQEKIESLAGELSQLPEHVQIAVGVKPENVGNASGIVEQLKQDSGSISVPVNYTKGEQAEATASSAAVNYTLGDQALPTPMWTDVNYRLGAQASPVTKTATVNYVLGSQAKPHTVTMRSQATGTVAFASGSARIKDNISAYVQGRDWTLHQNQSALVNEIGTESIVRDGHWFPIPGGAHVEQLKKGDIIFSAAQTDELIRTGRVTSGGGHGRVAMANGTAYNMLNAYGWGTEPRRRKKYGSSDDDDDKKKKKTTPKRRKKTTSGDDDSKDKSDKTKDKSSELKDWFDKFFDWAEVRMDRLKRITDKWATAAENAVRYSYNNLVSNREIDKQYTQKAKATRKAIAATDDQIGGNEISIGIYREQLRKITRKSSDLTPSLVRAIEDATKKGTFEISEYKGDSDKLAAIKEYQEWYEKILKCQESIDDLVESQKKLYEQLYNIPLEQAEAKVQKYEDALKRLTSTADVISGGGKGTGDKYFEDANDNLDSQIAERKRIAKANKKALKESEKNSREAELAGDTAKANRDAAANKLYTSGDLGKNKSLIRDAIKAGKEVDLNQIKGETTQAQIKAIERYNKAVREAVSADEKRKAAAEAQAKAEQEAALSELEYTKALQEAAKQKFDNVKDYYDSKNSPTNAMLGLLEQQRSTRDALGKSNVGKDARKSLLDSVGQNEALLQSQLEGVTELEQAYQKNRKNMTEEDRKAAESAILEAKTAAEQTEAAIAELFEELDKIGITKLERAMDRLQAKGTKLKEALELKEARGGIASEKDYKKLLGNVSDQSDNYREQIRLMQEQQKGYEKGSEKWQELQRQIEEYQSNLNDLTKSQLEYNKALAELPTTKAEKKIDKYNEALERLKAIGQTIAGGGKGSSSKYYEDENANLDEQTKKLKQIAKAREKAAKETSDKTDKSANDYSAADAKLKKNSVKLLDSKTYTALSKKDQKSVKDAVSKGKEIDTSKLTLTDKQKAAIEKYNELVRASSKAEDQYTAQIEAEKEAVQEAILAREEYNQAVQENAKAKFDNVGSYYDSQQGLIDARISQLEQRRSTRDAKGLSQVSADAKKNLESTLAQYQLLYATRQEEVEKLQEAYKKNAKNMTEEDRKAAQEAILNAKTASDKTIESIKEIETEIRRIPLKKLEMSMSRLTSKATDLQNALDIKESKGIQAAVSDYESLIKNSDKQIDNLQKQIALMEDERDGYSVGSEKYQELQGNIEDARQSIDDLTKSQISYNNAIVQLPIDTIEAQLDLLDAIASNIESQVSLKSARGKDLTESDYTDQMAQNTAKAEKVLKERRIAYENYLKALSDVDNVYGGKTADQWKAAYLNYDTTLNGLREAQESLKDSLRDDVYWRTFERAHDAAQRLKDVLSGISDLISEDMYLTKTGKLTEYGAAALANLVKNYETARDEVKNYSNDIANLNTLYKQGYYTSEEYKEKLGELQASLLSSASDVKKYTDSVISMYKDIAQKELDSLFDLIDARNDALSAKKEYYDYNKKISEKNKDIQNLNAEIAALTGVNTAEAKGKLAQLQADLADAQEDLSEALQDHAIDLSQDALSEMKDMLQESFDDRFDYINQNLDEVVELMTAANDLTTASAKQINATLNQLLSYYGINAKSTEIDKAYASGTRKVGKKVTGLFSEAGSEIVVTDKGLITTFNPGDGVIPHDLTERLYAMAMNGGAVSPSIGVANVKLPNLSDGRQTVVEQHYDSLINIEGSADAATVADLKNMQSDLLAKSYDYTRKKLYQGYQSVGGKRKV